MTVLLKTRPPDIFYVIIRWQIEISRTIFQPPKMQTHHDRARILYKGRRQREKCVVNPKLEATDSLTRWITSGGFVACEKEQFHLSQACGRPRNKIYNFYLPEAQQEVIMKVSHINPRYKWSRKIDLFLTSLYKDYCEISFHGASALHSHNLPVARPLAFWTLKQSFFKKKSYFLSDKLPGEQSVKQLLESSKLDDFKDDCPALAEKLVGIIRDTHAANLRHGDFQTGNIYAHFPQHAPDGRPEKVSDAKFFLLDYDGCSKVKIKTPWVKKIYDLKDLSLLVIPTISDEKLLEIYFDAPPSPLWLKIFRFWRNEGGNLRKWLGFSPKKENRHLAGEK